MKPDEFEKELQRQPTRQVPSEWRAEILRAASEAMAADAKRHDHLRRATLSLARSAATSRWRELLWPSPKAWAGLAAVWLSLVGLNVLFATRSTNIAKQSSNPVSGVEATLAAQRRELAQLLDNTIEPAPARKSSPPPGPRSERVTPPRV